ncbi:hypothetical protein J437_LFUL000229 [Ladona fulva]|uniref:SUN domain-containing protein n=1 Tax=Ladona fulva TaxID=123851 RepID=A0A8K0NX24_LADFU|nr:hypothetical protein J437_LFUL000229 [Ladona fulva]
MELEVCVCGGLAGAERGSIPIKASLVATSRLRPSPSPPLRKVDSTSFSRVTATQKGWMSAAQRLLPFTTLFLLPVAVYFALNCRLQGGTLSILCHRFTETKDAHIIDPVLELGKVLEEKVNDNKHVNDKGEDQLENPFISESNITEQPSIDGKDSPCIGTGCDVVSQTLVQPKVQDNESAAKAKLVTHESTTQQDSSENVVTEPKVVETAKTDVPVESPDVQPKPDVEEKFPKEKKTSTDFSKPPSLDIPQGDEKIKVEGQPSDLKKVKEDLGVIPDPSSGVSSSSTGSPSTPEPPTTASSPSASEDMPSFSEWTQKRLEEAERRKVQNDTSGQGGGDGSGAASPHGSGSSGGSSNGGTGAGTSVGSSSSASGSSSSGSSSDSNIVSVGSVSGGTKVRQKNYASPDCGAKIAAANPEAVSPGSVLSPSRDEYLLNACSSRSWFVVELCEAIRAKKIELANFELFSSSPKEFSVWISDRFPTRDWSLVGRFTAQDERTLQSFHIDLHVFTKFIRVEMHSHYGSEHFCPVSLFRVYGTSEFEVLETEQDDNEDGVGRSGDSSGSLVGEDVDEDSDVEELLDVETGGPPRNLFGSARDAVMSIVKKAAEALVKAGDSANETITLATNSPIKEDTKNEAPEPTFDGEEAESSLAKDKEGGSECKTLRHPPVCHGCEESVILRAAALLSCHYDTLRPLSSSPFVRSALASGGLCMNRFGLPLSAPNHSSSTTATDAGYISALLPTEYLVALCNALITPDMVRDTELAVPEPPPSEVPTEVENQTVSVTLGSHVRSDSSPKSGTSSSTIASMIKPTKTLKGDDFESDGLGESAHDPGGPEELSLSVVMSSPVIESPQSTYMPGFTQLGRGDGSLYQDIMEGLEDSPNLDTDTSASSWKQDFSESAGESLEKDSVPSGTEVSETESIPAVAVTESSGGVAITSTSSVSSSSSTTQSPASSSSSASPVQAPQQTGDSSPSQGSQSTGSKGSEGTIPVPNVPPPVQSPHIQTSTGSGTAKGTQEAGSPPPPPLPNTGVAQKESVFVRLSNRIKTLERNMSLSAQYLEELSRRYRKQFEEAQKQAVEAQKRDKRLAEDAANLQARLDILAEAVKGLLDARKREEEQKMKEKEEEEAKLREEQEYGRHFPWWSSVLYWLWSTTGRVAVTVAQHAVIFCVELVVLWALMGHYQRRRWDWSAVPTAPTIETGVHQVHNLEDDAQNQLKYGSLRKRRKWTKEDDWTEVTEMGRSPRKRRPTINDVDGSIMGETESLVLDSSTGQQQHKQRRRRRKLKSSSTASVSSLPVPLLPPGSNSPFPPPYSEAEPSLSAPPIENLNGWTWPCHSPETIQRATILEDGFKQPDNESSKEEVSDIPSPNTIQDKVSKDRFSKSKSRRVSDPIFFQDNERLPKNPSATSPLSRSSSQIHSSLRICSPKLKADNWEWFTGARISGELASKNSRAASSINSNSALPYGDGRSSPESTEASGRTAGTSSPTPSSSSSKSKDKKSGSGNNSGGGSSFKRIVKRFF